jgi:hypothetical protein
LPPPRPKGRGFLFGAVYRLRLKVLNAVVRAVAIAVA